MSKLLIPVGIPGCGKSTFARTYLHAIVHSSDEIRERVFGDVNDMSNNDAVFEIYHADIAHDLQHGLPVYADATNLRPFARRKLYDIARDNDAEIHLILFNNAAQAVRRNSMRDRVVPQDVMLKFLFQLEQARRDVFTEPVHSIITIDDVQSFPKL